MKHFLLFALISCTYVTSAQEFEVPLNPRLITAADYEAQQDTALAAFDWLMKTPPKVEAEKRQDVHAYLLKWMTGTKAVSIGLDDKILTFIESSPDLLMIFMGGWVKYAIETKDKDNQLEGNKHGLEAVLEYYTKLMLPVYKDKNVDKYVKMRNEGTLAKFLEKTVR